MKSYPSIAYYNQCEYDTTAYLFDKLDGSSMRFEYSKKRGFYKFGTKNCLIDENHEQFGEGVSLFLNKYNDDLIKMIKSEKLFRNVDRMMVFSEYLGDNSFAGQHDINDKKDVVLFDIWLHKKGFIKPNDFVEVISSNVHTPKFLGKFNYDDELINKIKNNDIENIILKEGVVCKGILNTKSDNNVWMTKIKTNEWLDKIKSKLGEKALLDELNGDITLL